MMYCMFNHYLELSIMTHNYTFHSDPGHGWLEVPLSMLRALQIADKITPYSYMKGKTAFLEEDCDLSTFLQAYRLRFGHDPNMAELHADVSPIRGFQSYRR